EARGVRHENALHPDVEAYLPDGEGRTDAGAVALDDDPLEHLDAELVAFDDLVVDGDSVADPEVRNIFADSRGLKGLDFGERRDHVWARSVGRARDYALEARRVKRSRVFAGEGHEMRLEYAHFCRAALAFARDGIEGVAADRPAPKKLSCSHRGLRTSPRPAP